MGTILAGGGGWWVGGVNREREGSHRWIEADWSPSARDLASLGFRL